MRTRAPIVTSLSTAEPRPTTEPSPITARSRTCAWSPTIAPAPTRAPATTTAPAQIVAPGPITAGSGASRAAVERLPSANGLPMTTPSWILAPAPIRVPAWITTLPPTSTSSGSSTSSPRSIPGAQSDWCNTRALLERALERLQHPDDPQAALGAGARLGAVEHAIHEVTALDPERLLVRDPRTVDVAGAGDVLAVRGEVLVEALVVDGELALDLHVVEGRHPLGADDREAPLLVRVEPAEMEVRGETRREAQVAEHHVLHPLVHVALADGPALVRVLPGKAEHDRHVVGAEAPERALVGAELAEVEAVAVDVTDVAELARGHELLQPLHAGVVLEQVADH